MNHAVHVLVPMPAHSALGPGTICYCMGPIEIGARVVICSTLHFEPSGASRLKRRVTLPLTAAKEVNLVVTEVGMFEIQDGKFHLKECFAPYTPEWILEKTDADIHVDAECRVVQL